MGSGVSLISEIESVRRHSRENSLPKDSEGVEHFVASNGDKVPISSLRVPAAEIEEFEKLQLASREKLSILRNLDIFVLDNTVRETTVAQPRGHTQEDKFRILDMVHRCGFRDCVVAAFGTLERVDDAFVQALVKSGADMATNWAFSEVYEGYQDGVPLKDIPQGLQRMQRYRIQNAILERDFNCAQTAWGSAWQEEEEADMLVQRVEWVRENLGGRALINIRDFSEACADNLPRVLYIVERLAGMPSKPFGLIFEEPSGTIFPFEFSAVVRIVRQKMISCGWEDGQFLVHIHRNYGLAEAAVMECLAQGATGIWCATCLEGAATGHACSTITLSNLARIGNKHVLERFNLPLVRKTAIEVTKIVTGSLPEPSTEVYGVRALDVCFDGGMGSGESELSKIFKEKSHIRLTTMATPKMFQKRMVELFGGDESAFDLEVMAKMQAIMHEDLRSGRKEEYNSPVGAQALFERAGGKVTEAMMEIVVAGETLKDDPLIIELKELFLENCSPGTDAMSFRVFYDMFMCKYVPCFACQFAQEMFNCFDINANQELDWKELELRAIWVKDEYSHEIKRMEDVLDILFQRLLIPELMEKVAYKFHQRNFFKTNRQLLHVKHQFLRNIATHIKASEAS